MGWKYIDGANYSTMRQAILRHKMCKNTMYAEVILKQNLMHSRELVILVKNIFCK